MKRARISALAVAGASAILAACATAPQEKTGAAAVASPAGKEDCIFFRTLSDWIPIDRERMLIYGMGRVPYLATLSFPMNSMPFEFAVAFHDNDRDGRLCGFSSDAVLFRDGIPDRINITSLQRLDPGEAKKFLAEVKDARKRKIEPQPESEAAGSSATTEPKDE